jgi:hypothetical protein
MTLKDAAIKRLERQKGKFMNYKNELQKISSKNNGIIKTSDFSMLKINNYGIRKLVGEGTVEKIKNGYYRLSEDAHEMSEAALISRLFPDGILCMYTALFYYGYSDRTPLSWDIAISKDVSKSRFNLDYPYVQPYYIESHLLLFGVTIAQYDDCQMKIFDKDRLICECLKYESKMDKETFNKAIQNYISDNSKSIPKLLEYAKRRRILKKVKERIGVWL